MLDFSLPGGMINLTHALGERLAPLESADFDEAFKFAQLLAGDLSALPRYRKCLGKNQVADPHIDRMAATFDRLARLRRRVAELAAASAEEAGEE